MEYLCTFQLLLCVPHWIIIKILYLVNVCDVYVINQSGYFIFHVDGFDYEFWAKVM